jgi:hypothetical protein
VSWNRARIGDSKFRIGDQLDITLLMKRERSSASQEREKVACSGVTSAIHFEMAYRTGAD